MRRKKGRRKRRQGFLPKKRLVRLLKHLSLKKRKSSVIRNKRIMKIV
jgi:hypothetical protein